MANINNKFKKILKEVEANVKSKEDLEYIKTQLFEVYNLFFEELNRIEELATTKISNILEVQVQMEERINKIEKDLKELQGDIYDDESEFAILCPYCNNEFIIDSPEQKEEIECPECSNIIELDWGLEEGGCSCDECHGCGHEDDDM